MGDPSREVSCSTAALLVFICVANQYQASYTEFYERDNMWTTDDSVLKSYLLNQCTYLVTIEILRRDLSYLRFRVL